MIFSLAYMMLHLLYCLHYQLFNTNTYLMYIALIISHTVIRNIKTLPLSSIQYSYISHTTYNMLTICMNFDSTPSTEIHKKVDIIRFVYTSKQFICKISITRSLGAIQTSWICRLHPSRAQAVRPKSPFHYFVSIFRKFEEKN